MIDGRIIGKPLPHPGDHLRCQGDLRHQQQHLSALLDHLPGITQEHLALAAPGHPMQQYDLMMRHGVQRSQRFALLGAKG